MGRDCRGVLLLAALAVLAAAGAFSTDSKSVSLFDCEIFSARQSRGTRDRPTVEGAGKSLVLKPGFAHPSIIASSCNSSRIVDSRLSWIIRFSVIRNYYFLFMAKCALPRFFISDFLFTLAPSPSTFPFLLRNASIRDWLWRSNAKFNVSRLTRAWVRYSLIQSPEGGSLEGDCFYDRLRSYFMSNVLLR